MKRKNIIVIAQWVIIFTLIVFVIELDLAKSKIEKQIITKQDSLQFIIQKQDSLDQAFVFEQIGVSLKTNSNFLKVNDSLHAVVYLTASQFLHKENKNAFLTYQILNSDQYSLIEDTHSMDFSDYYLKHVKVDTIILSGRNIPISFSTSIAGQYYLRGAMNVPIFNYKNEESYVRLPFRENILFK